MSADPDKLLAFITEFREEIQEAISSIKSEADPQTFSEMFEPSTITAALMLSAYDYCRARDVEPGQFICAIRALADKMEMDLPARIGENRA